MMTLVPEDHLPLEKTLSQTPASSTIGDDNSLEFRNWDLFWNNVQYHQPYNNVCKKIKKVKESQCRIYFFQQCLRYEVVPQTIQSRSNIHPGMSKNAAAKLENNNKQASLNNLKTILTEERVNLTIAKADLDCAKSVLFAIVDEPKFRPILEESFQKKSRSYHQQSENKYHQKLRHLRNIQGRQGPCLLYTSDAADE